MGSEWFCLVYCVMLVDYVAGTVGTVLVSQNCQ